MPSASREQALPLIDRKQLFELARDEDAAQHLLTLLDAERATHRTRLAYAESIINVQDQLICRYDKAGQVTFANHAFCRYVGLKAADIIGQHIAGILMLSSTSAFDAQRRDLFEDPQSIVYDAEVESGPKARHWLRWKEQSIVAEDGTIKEVQAVGIDVTANRLAQFITERTIAQYRMLVQNMPGTTVLLFDKEHRYVLAEGSLIQEIAESPQAIEGRTLREVWPSAVVTQVEPAYTRALQGQASNRTLHLDNRIFDVNIVPLPYPNQNEPQGLAVIRDVTEQRRNAAALLENEARLKQITDHVDAVLFLYDVAQDKMVYISPAFEDIWGISRNAIADNWDALYARLHPDDLERAIAFAYDEEGFNTPKAIELRLLHPTKGERVLRARTTPIFEDAPDSPTPNRLPVRVMAVVDDITALKQSEKQAIDLAIERERMRVLTHFIDTAAHEFRTPLSVIATHAYLMSTSHDSANRAESNRVIAHHVDSIDYLLNRLVTMSKLDGGTDVSMFPTSLRTIVLDAIAAVSRRVVQQRIEMQHQIDDERFAVLADARLLGMALRELLDNAVRYTPEHGVINVTLRRDGTTAEITVQDTGCGMPHEVLDKAFQRFYRADTAHTTKGFGLGLPIARRVLEIHGGTIQLSSTPDIGTTATVLLPLTSPSQ